MTQHNANLKRISTVRLSTTNSQATGQNFWQLASKLWEIPPQPHRFKRSHVHVRRRHMTHSTSLYACSVGQDTPYGQFKYKQYVQNPKPTRVSCMKQAEASDSPRQLQTCNNMSSCSQSYFAQQSQQVLGLVCCQAHRKRLESR